MAAGGGDDHISIDDSDRENFRRRGRSPASKQGGPVERGREHRERERGDHEIARSLERADNGRSERSLGSNRGGNGREKERSEQEFVRSSGRSRDLRRERSPGSTGGSHERDDSNKPARGAEREDNGRRRDRSPFRRGFTTRDRERGSERRESWRRDRSPVSRRGGSRERERGERRYGRGFDRANNGRREISPGSKRGASRDRFGRGQDDVARGGLGRGDHVRRDVRSLTRVADKRGNDNSERGGFDRRDRGRRGRSSESNDGIETGGRERNSDVDSRKGIARKSLSATEDGEGTPPVRDLENTIVQEDGRATDDEAKRHDLEYLRETSDSGSGELKNGDDGSNRRDSEENAERKQQILSKIATEDTRNAVSDEDVDEGVNREGRTKDTPKPDDEGSGDSYADSEEDEDGDDEKEKKRKSRRREKRRRHHGENEEGRIKGSRKLDVDKDHSASGSEEDKENDEVRARRKNPKRREKHRRHGGKHSEHSRGKKRKHRRRGTSSDEASESDSASTSSEVSESEDSAQREKAKKHRKKRRRKEKEREVEREMKRKMKKKMRELKEKRLKAELKKKKKEIRSKRPITSSWGKYGILKDIDMWYVAFHPSRISKQRKL